MADYYVSSVAYAAVAQWAATTAYTVGQFVRPLTTPATGSGYVYRCTTAGTSAGTEPTWPTANNNAVTNGTAAFTCVGGQSTYGWSAAVKDIITVSNSSPNGRATNGDRIFLSSDHSESFASSTTYSFGGNSWVGMQLISVNRAGSVPPVAADIQAGAAVTLTAGNMTLELSGPMFWQGITFTLAGSSNAGIFLGSGGNKFAYFKDCALKLTNTNSAARIYNNAQGTKTVFDNSTVQFGHANQSVVTTSGMFTELIWINTLSAIAGATIPTTLFSPASGSGMLVTARGVDFSAITGTLLGTSNSAYKVLLDSCRIASGVTRFYTPSTTTPPYDEVELVNCFDGTNIINERYSPLGALTIERSTTLTGGAADDVGAFSFKLVSGTRSDKFSPSSGLESFWLDVDNSSTGSSKTATVEIVSSASLNANDIHLMLEYMGTSGSSIASGVSSLASAVTSSALPSSAASWSSPPSTPVYQYLQVTFTPQTAGRVRGIVRLGKPSTTVYVNPQLTIA